jgi:quercetin dioxygenase-like cupin family protein
MPRLRVEAGRLSRCRVQHFGALRLRPLLHKPALGHACVFHISLHPGKSVPASCHRRTHEFFLILGGSVRARIDGRSRTFRKGDFCFLPAGSVHAFHAGRSGAETLAVFSPRLDLKRSDIVAVHDEAAQ